MKTIYDWIHSMECVSCGTETHHTKLTINQECYECAGVIQCDVCPAPSIGVTKDGVPLCGTHGAPYMQPTSKEQQ